MRLHASLIANLGTEIQHECSPSSLLGEQGEKNSYHSSWSWQPMGKKKTSLMPALGVLFDAGRRHSSIGDPFWRRKRQENSTILINLNKQSLKWENPALTHAWKLLASFVDSIPVEFPGTSTKSYAWCWWYVQKERKTTNNSGDSLVVTHLTTNSTVHCLYMGHACINPRVSFHDYIEIQLLEIPIGRDTTCGNTKL